MARSGWHWLLFLELGLGLLSGCTVPLRSASVAGGSPSAASAAGANPTGQASARSATPAPTPQPLEIVLPANSPYHPAVGPGTPVVPTATPRRENTSLPAQEAESTSEAPAETPHKDTLSTSELTRAPASSLPGEAAAPTRAEKRSLPETSRVPPLAAALTCYLQDQPQKASALLQAYPASSQAVYHQLLPVLAELTHHGLEQLPPKEAAAFHEQLTALAEQLRPRSRLLLANMCFCRRIDGFGQYQRLPEGHVFRAGRRGEPGEPVQLYVEVRNFALARCPQGYKTYLSSTVEICDAHGQQQWYHSFKDQEGPLYRQSPWQDCFGCYRFALPILPPGSYTLILTIRDLTYPDNPRQAQQALPMRVG